jgi:hypothetical protein
MAEPTIQLGGGNWAGKSDNLLGYYKEGERFYKQDFTFSRSTSGTRVNSSGLIETANVLSSELVTNGDFATDSDWTKGSGWIISGGKATKSGTDLAYLTQSSLTSVVGKTYRVKASVTNVTTGNIRIDSFTSGTTYTSNVEIDITYTATSAGVFRFLGWGGFDGSVDNVSVKEVIQNNIPRVDYLNNSNGSLILEPQRTNVLVQSTNFSGGWSLDDATKISNSTTSPDGTTNAITLIGNTNASRHHIRQGAAGSVTASLSVFAKAKELRYLQIASANSPSQYVNFDVSDGTIGTVGSGFTNAKIEDYGNGWYRCSVTSTNQYFAMYISLVSSLTSSWLESWTMSNNTDGLYLYGAQLEANASYATSYIPTSGSSVTRNADACSITNVADRIGQTEGTMFVEVELKSASEQILIITSASGNEVNRLQIYIDANRKIGLYRGDNSVNILSSSTYSLNSVLKIAAVYKSNDYALYVNGVSVGTDTSGTIPPTPSLLYLGSYVDGSKSNTTIINHLQLYNTRLSNSELATLTT